LTITAPLIVEHQWTLRRSVTELLRAFSAESGNQVRAGTVLARLHDRQLTANLEAARAKTPQIAADLKWEAKAEVLKADYVRAQRLWNEKVACRQNNNCSYAKYKAESDHGTFARKESSIPRRGRTFPSSWSRKRPVSWRPSEDLVAPVRAWKGNQVNKGDRLFWVTAEGPLRVRFTLPESFWAVLKRTCNCRSPPPICLREHFAKIVN